MALRITPGYKSLNLYFDQPTNAYNVDDVDSSGTTQAVQNDIRTDLQGLKVWISTTSWGSNTPTSGELYYDGPFQGYLAIDKISQASTNTLADNTTYYIKYAFISKLQPNPLPEQITYLPIINNASGEQTGTTLDVALPLQGYLTRDPIEIPTDENGSNPVYTNAIGQFKVYKYSQDISTTSDVTYAIKSNSSTGGVAISFGTGNSKNIYTVSAITDLTGTITLQATYTDPLNNANTITIEQVLNVSKRRPGQTAPLVVLTATGQVFVLTEDSSGSSKSPANVKITATASNITNPTYTWTLDPSGTNTPIEGTGAGYTGGTLTGTTLNAGKDELTISSSFFTGATPQFKLFKVVVGSSVVGSTISVNDLMSIYYLKEGSDSLAMGLINENQTVTLDKTGTVISGLPIESEAVVVEGTTQLTAPAITFAVNSQSGFGGTLTINTATNTPVNGKPAGYIRATQITANQATATITATVAGTTLSKVLTVNRVQDGADGTNIDAQLTNDFHAVPTAADGTGAVYTGASTTIEVYKNGVLQTSGFTFYVSGLQNIKYRGTGDTSDRTGTGTTNGALTATSGTAIVDIVELSSDSGYVDITARQTSDGQLFTERFSLSRNKAGIIGKDAVIYQIKPNAKAISKQSSDVDTDGIHTPGNLIFSVYKTVGNNTAALLTDQSLYYIQWNSPDQEPPNTDANAQLLPALGYVSVVLANSLDKSSVNLKLLYKNSANNYTQLDREEVPIVFKGTKGDSGTSVDIVFARGSSPPALTGTANPPNASWSTNVASATGTGILWSSTGYSSDGGTTWAWDTAVQVEGTTGSNGESVAEISAFTRTANDLSSTSITGGSYDFSNKTLTVPTGGSVTWYSYIPIGTTPIWETRTTAAVTAPTTVDNILTWSTPVKTAQEGPSGNPARGVDISGAASINYNTTTNTYSPAAVTLTALPQNITPTSYTWTSPDITATFSGQSGATIVMTPNGTPSSITVKVVVTDGTNSAEKTITIAISNNGTPGLPGTPARGVDISGAAGLRYNTNTSSYSPTTLSLTALPQNITPTSYTWTSPDITAAFSGQSGATIIMTPNGTPSVIKVKVVASDGTNSAEKTITIAVANDGAAGQVGQHGKKSATPSLYTWTSSASPPTKPTSSVYYWNTVGGNTAGSLTIAGNVGNVSSKGYWYTSSAEASAAIAETTGDYLWEITATLTVDAATWTGTYPNQTLTAVDSTTIIWSSYTPIAIGYLSAGTPGTPGTPGSGSYSIPRNSNQSTSSPAPQDAEVNTATGRTTGPVDGDIAVVYISGVGSTSWRRLAGSWSVISQYLNGDVIVQGTIDANRLQIGNNTGSSRTVLTNNKIEIYDSNVLRVKIGNLA